MRSEEAFGGVDIFSCLRVGRTRVQMWTNFLSYELSIRAPGSSEGHKHTLAHLHAQKGIY